MTTIFQQSVTCGHCGTENEVIELGSTNSFGSMDLDMRPPPMERDTLAQQIHRCQGCGYCAPDLGERIGADGLLESDNYRALLADERYPDLARKVIAYAFLAESSGDLRAASTRIGRLATGLARFIRRSTGGILEIEFWVAH